MHSVNTISNNKIKEIVKLHQKKYRDELNLFIAEGKKALEECLNSDIKIKDIFALKSFNVNEINAPVTVVDEAVMKKISTTDSVCEVLIVAEKKEIDKKMFSSMKKVALVDSIADPGNLGTIIRSAAAFNIEGIVLFGDCVDLYSSKVVRSCTGNFFKVPVISVKTVLELQQLFPSHTFVATALSKENNISLSECKNLEKSLIMLGSEAKGLSSDLLKIAQKNIKLDMANQVESLNLSVCASIIFYELFA